MTIFARPPIPARMGPGDPGATLAWDVLHDTPEDALMNPGSPVQGAGSSEDFSWTPLHRLTRTSLTGIHPIYEPGEPARRQVPREHGAGGGPLGPPAEAACSGQKRI